MSFLSKICLDRQAFRRALLHGNLILRGDDQQNCGILVVQVDGLIENLYVQVRSDTQEADKQVVIHKFHVKLAFCP